jgi:O-antigen ligase
MSVSLNEIMDRLKKMLRWVFLMFVFSIPISQFLSVRLLVATLTLLLFSGAKLNSNKKVFLSNLNVVFYLGVLIFGLFYSQDIKTGLSALETCFGLVAIPLIFSMGIHFLKINLKKTVEIFLMGLAVACLICLGKSVVSYFQTGLINSFFFYQFTNILDFQPTYFAYYLCFAITALLYFVHYEKIKIPILVSIVLALFFFAILMLTAGRTAYISMLFVFAFFILKFLFEDTHSLNTSLTFGVSSLLLICMLLINYFDINTGFGAAAENNDYWERITLWQSAIKANQNLWFGVGTGDYRTVLNDYFMSHGLSDYAKSSFNAHNQFIQSFLSNGLVGLFSLLLLLGHPLYLSVKHQNVLGILTFFSFFIYGMTEVFLNRYQGLIFFAFLHQTFVFYYYGKTHLYEEKN